MGLPPLSTLYSESFEVHCGLHILLILGFAYAFVSVKGTVVGPCCRLLLYTAQHVLGPSVPESHLQRRSQACLSFKLLSHSLMWNFRTSIRFVSKTAIAVLPVWQKKKVTFSPKRKNFGCDEIHLFLACQDVAMNHEPDVALSFTTMLQRVWVVAVLG